MPKTSELNKKIKILYNVSNGKTSEGVPKNDWRLYKKVWAKVENLFGREYFAAQAVQSEKTVKFIIRYCNGVDESMRIIFNNKVYEINFVDDIKYKHTWMEIKTSEVKK